MASVSALLLSNCSNFLVRDSICLLIIFCLSSGSVSLVDTTPALVSALLLSSCSNSLVRLLISPFISLLCLFCFSSGSDSLVDTTLD